MNIDRQAIGEFLEANGYKIAQSTRHHGIRATRSNGRNRETILLWAPLVFEPHADREQVLAELTAAAVKEPAALRLVILPSLLSFRADFQTLAAKSGGVLRAYAQFFDAPFREDPAANFGLGAEGSEEAGRFARRLIRPERLDADVLQAVARPQQKSAREVVPDRVHQPYVLTDTIAKPEAGRYDGHDLLQHLMTRLSQPAAGSEVHLIVGPAGAGKTYLFEALFTYLYLSFQLAKAKQQLRERPIPVVPESLLSAKSYTSEALFEAIRETQVAGALHAGLLDWSVRKGRVILMFDGLDEFFAEQDDFFEQLTARHLSGDSSARIFIVLRDSLLSTSPNVRRLVERLARLPGCSLNIYHLTLWDKVDPKRMMAWLRIEKRRPAPGEADTPAVRQFLALLAGSPVMNELATLPYYCERLLERFMEGPKSGIPGSIDGLLGFALEKLIDREWGKHRQGNNASATPQVAFLQWRDAVRLMAQRLPYDSRIVTALTVVKAAFGQASAGTDVTAAFRQAVDALFADRGEGALIGLLEEAAYTYRRHAADGKIRTDDAGLTGGQLDALYNRDLSWALASDDRQKGERILRQFALFSQGAGGGIEFTHEIMADYLAARFVLQQVRQTPTRFCEIVGTPVGDETPVFTRYLREAFEREPDLARSIRRVTASVPESCAAYVRQML